MAVNGVTGANYLVTQVGRPYEEQKCDKAVVTNVIRRCPGGDPNYRTGGCTELWNSINSSSKYRHITKRMTLAEAKKEGLLIGDLPVIYDANTGKCEHIAYYMGGIGGYECIHSSKKKDCVCGTTLANGFTHVLRHRDIKGVPVGEVSNDREEPTMNVLYIGVVNTDGGALNMRKRASTSSRDIGDIPCGAQVNVLEETNAEWLKVEYAGQTGYVASRYIAEQIPASDNAASTDNGNWGVFVPCVDRARAEELAELFNVAVVCQKELND